MGAFHSMQDFVLCPKIMIFENWTSLGALIGHSVVSYVGNAERVLFWGGVKEMLLFYGLCMLLLVPKA